MSKKDYSVIIHDLLYQTNVRGSCEEAESYAQEYLLVTEVNVTILILIPGNVAQA